jgi:hypothetical protein
MINRGGEDRARQSMPPSLHPGVAQAVTFAIPIDAPEEVAAAVVPRAEGM